MMSCPSNTPSANAKIEPGQYGFRTSYPPLQKTGLNLSPKTEWQITTPKNTYVQSCYYEGELNTYPDREGIETFCCAKNLSSSELNTYPDREGIETSSTSI